MATSTSSDEISIPPKDFHISTSSDSGSRLSPNRQKCPLCGKFRKTFYCKDCVHSGLFYTSKSKATEGYADKQKVLIELEDKRKNLQNNCLKYIENRAKADVLCTKIKQNRDKNRTLKLALEEKKQRRIVHKEKLISLKQNNEERHKSLPKYDQKIHSLESYIERKFEEYDRNSEAFKKGEINLKKLTKLRVHQLFKYIFPITKVSPKVEMESSDTDMVSAIADASRTTYISDRWEYTDYSSEMKYCIVGPTLPASGNYSAYNIWVAQNRDVPSPNTQISVSDIPAYTISAALTYTAQLVHVLSFYLDVRLPFKMILSDMAQCRMTEQQFARRVARLNANILYLCFFQNVDLSLLRSNETIHNLLQLLNESADLGRQGPIELDLALGNALEQPLSNHLHLSEDSDSEEDNIPAEWEAVPHVQSPEVQAGAGALVAQSTQQMMTTQQASSMAGGLVNSAAASIASIWRGFTGR
ncbi:unnamed protein product [Brassicogethes aeneus]|uniref:Beclin 1-associated autophagy-related key regulator n=1 Tax=Brassicogethes aeneus TaxID=1431903 RepID=A0A9P0AZ43_BRAAE|nr:unnamed protein product [Brassicogethes aeneus]